jgi:hypothetical protein
MIARGTITEIFFRRINGLFFLVRTFVDYVFFDVARHPAIGSDILLLTCTSLRIVYFVGYRHYSQAALSMVLSSIRWYIGALTACLYEWSILDLALCEMLLWMFKIKSIFFVAFIT